MCHFEKERKEKELSETVKEENDFFFYVAIPNCDI